MAGVKGRGTQGRTATVATTSGSTAITAPAGTFEKPEDVGRTITGTGIPANATITAVASDTAATLSAAATATGGSVSVTFGKGRAQDYGFTGWSPLSKGESTAWTVAGGGGATAPDRITSPAQGREHRWPV